MNIFGVGENVVRIAAENIGEMNAPIETEVAYIDFITGVVGSSYLSDLTKNDPPTEMVFTNTNENFESIYLINNGVFIDSLSSVSEDVFFSDPIVRVYYEDGSFKQYAFLMSGANCGDYDSMDECNISATPLASAVSKINGFTDDIDLIIIYLEEDVVFETGLTLTNKEFDLQIIGGTSWNSGTQTVITSSSKYSTIEGEVNISLENRQKLIIKNVIFSSREIEDNNYAGGTSTGDSEDIYINATEIEMTNVEIYAQGNNSFTGGNVDIFATDHQTADAYVILLGDMWIVSNSAKLSMDNVTIKGRFIEASASAKYTSEWDLFGDSFSDGTTLGSVFEKLEDWLGGGLIPLPIGFTTRKANALVELDNNTSLESEFDVCILSSATADISVNSSGTLAPFSVTVGVGFSDANIEIKDTVSIVAHRDVLIKTNAIGMGDVIAKVEKRASYDAQPSSNEPETRMGGFSVAVSYSEITSDIKMESGAKINADRFANLIANGENNVNNSAKFFLNNMEGNAGITVAVNLSYSDVKVEVNGTITAGGSSQANANLMTLDVDPTALNLNEDTFTVEDHGYKTGDVVYYSSTGTPIGGLENDHAYIVLVIDEDTFTLMSEAALNINNQNVISGTLHKLSPIDMKYFKPAAGSIGNGDGLNEFDLGSITIEANNVILFNINNHGFLNEEELIYSAMGTHVIPGLADYDSYYVFVVDSDHFRLSSSVNSTDLTKLIKFDSDLANSDPYNTYVYEDYMHGFSYVDRNNGFEFDASTNASVVNSNRDEITFASAHGLVTGDVLYYETADQTTTMNIHQTYLISPIDGESVDLVTNFITTSSINYENGDELVYYSNGNDAVGGLVDGETYYVGDVNSDQRQFRLFTTLADAISGTNPIDLSSGATGLSHQFNQVVETVVNDIPISGLEDETLYYVVVIDNKTIQLTENSIPDTVGKINLTSTGSGEHFIDGGLVNGIGIKANLNSTLKSTSLAGLGKGDTNLVDIGVSGVISSVTTPMLNNIKKKLGRNTDINRDAAKFSLSASPAIVIAENNVQAIVGSLAVLESDHDIEVSATTKQIFQTYVESSSTKLNSGESSFSGAVALSVNLIENNVEAIIEGGAQVDAIETLSVLSDIKYPFITHPYDYDPIGIDEIAEADETTGKITAIKEGLMSTMDGKLGLQRLLFHSWTTSRTAPSGEAPASDVAVTGTVSIISMDTTCVAKIGAGALINQKVAMQTSNTQSVEVISTALANIFYLTGNISLNLQPVPGAGGNGAIDTYKKKLKNAKDQLNPLNWINLYGAEGGKLGLGGTVMVANIDFDTRATIEANSKVHTGINGSISVEAETTGFYLFITEAGGKSDKVAISATVPVVTLNNKTIAKISGTAVIEAGDISLSALDDLVLLNVAGGISSSHSIGIGATIGINNISRETLAFVGNQETGETGLWNVVFNSNGDASDISATVLPDINGPAYQETKVEGKLNTQEVVIVDIEGNTNSDATFKLNFNGAITTDIAYQATEEEVQAALDALNIPGGVQVTQGDEDAWVIIFNNFGDQDSFEVESTTDFDIDATVEINTYLEGAVDTQEEQLIILDQDISEGVFTVRFGENSRNKTVPLYWDVSAADLEAAIEALDGVDDVQVTQTTNDDGDKEFSILFNTFGLQNRFYINGVNEYNGTPNISITQGTYSTQEVVAIENPSYQGAFVLEYNGLTSAPIEWDASNEEIEAALIVLGANVDVLSGDVQNVMSTPSIKATRLDINAENKGLVVVLAITGVMISKEDSGGSGGSDDSSGNNQSKIPTGGVPTVFKQMSLLQQGHSLDDIRSGKYKDNISAKDQGVQSPASTNSPTKTGSASISLAGSVSIMMLEDVVKASIQNAGLITLSEDANIVAKNSTKMINVAGSAALNLKSGSSAGSLSIGIAGAVTYNELTGKTETGIDHTAIKARDISTSATQEGLIISVSAGVAGDLAKKGISIAGSISLNYLDNDTASRMTDASIELSGGLSSSADDDRLAVVVAGAVAFGGMAGIGASVAINNIESDTIARIDNSNIDYATWIKQEAESSKQLTSISATIALSKKFGVAGTVSINKIIGQNLASISGGNIDSDDAGSNIILEAYDDSVISSISGAVGGGKTAGLGAAFAYNKLDNDVVATIDDGATINILGNIDVLASADGKIETISAGGAGAQTIGFSAAISINLLLNDVIASINQATITTDGSITVNAKSNNTVHALAGNVAGAGKVALGASVGYNIFNTITSAYIKDSTIISKKHVLVDANEDSEVYALAAGGQFSGKVAIGGSVVITDADSKITAFIDNSTVTADGNIRVSATDDRYLFLLAGVINGAGTVAFGVSANVLLTYNNVSAYVSNSTISAQAIKGKKKIKGADRTMKDYSGVAVVAASKEEMLSFAVGGSGAGTAAINVSGSVNLPEEETEAWIENSSVNVGVTGDDQQQSVIVRAIDDTELWGIAGAIGGAGTAGIGLGADVGMLEKNTRAYVEYSTIETLNNDVIVQAISTEDIFSVSASGGLAGTVGIAGATSIYTLEINTVAYILGDTTTIFANDSVLVSAYDETSLFIVSGSISGAGTVSVGGVVTFSSYEKDVFAYVCDGVEINALANGDGIEVHDGTYNITWTDGITDPNNANYGDADPVNINATNIDDGNDEIIINDHGYETGTAVIYTNTSGSAIPGLVDGETYYIIKIDENRFKLSTTLEGSRNYVNDSTNSDSDDGIDEFIDLGSSAGEHTIEYADISINYEVKVDPPVVDSSSDIDEVNDTITIAAHGFETGTAVTYSKVSGDVISGLEDGETYYVVKIDDDTFQLSTSLLGAKNSSIIDLETVAGEHTIWNGNLNKPTTDIDMYGHEGMDNDFDNKDGDDIDNEMLQALDQIPTAVPGTKTVNGLAVTAINQDDLMTIAASAGGSGTCAVEISGAINLIEVEVNAYIGDANINQDNSHYTNTGTEQSVTVIAANDLYLLNVSAAAGFSGAVAITPNAGVNIIDNTISAHIDDANVRAYKDVIVTANAKETLVTIAAGISGSGAAAIDASVDVLFLTNNVFAYIGDESDAGSKGATVLAFGNVLVDAQHASDIISVAGSIAVGNFGGGAGVGIYNFENNVRAFIGPHSKVDALARSTSLANVYDGTRDSDNVLQKHTAYYGVAVQTINSEEILAISAAVGGGAAFGLGGGVQIDTFESDVQAYIGHDSHINMDALNTSAGSDQAVTVFASNSADIFSFAGALGIGISTGALSGAVAVGVIRNDSLAFVEERTQIAANDDVKVIALNNREVLSITVSGSIGCYAGIAGAVTIWTIGDEHNSAYEASDDSVEYEVDHEGERFGTVQENVLITTDDDDNERTTISNSQQVGLVVDALLSTLTGFDTMSDEEHKINQNRVDATNKIENKTNQKLDRTKIEDILNATDTDVVGSETTVYLGASVDVNIRSNGDGSLIVKADDNFEFEPIVGSLGGGLVGLGAGVIIANVGSKSEAYFAEHVDVEVNNNIGDVIVEATFTEDIYAQGYGGGVGAVTASAKVIILNDTTSQYAHLENNAEIRSANIVRVKAHADRKIDFDTLEIGVAGVAINVIVVISDISGITYAYADNPQIGQVAGMTVNDFEIIANQDIEGELIGRLIGASAGFSLSGLVIISDINNDIQAYQNNGDVKLARNMKIDAQQNADILIDVPEVICASFTGSIGATVILSENISTIKAYVSNDPTLTIGGNFDMKTLYDSKIEIEVLGVSAGLAAGIGVIVVDVEETPTIENHFYGNAIISGDYTQQSKINDVLIVDLTGVSAGVMAGIGITLSWAENETSVSTGVQNGSVINANNMLIKNIIDIDVDNDIITVGAGLLAGTGNDGDAEITLKKADAFINTSNIDITNSLTVLSEIGLNARMIIEGYSGGGIAVGVTLADSFIDAESVNTYIKNSNVSASELIVKTKYGFDQDNNKVGAYIETDAAGGGLLAGNGAEANAENTATINAYISGGNTSIKSKLEIVSDATVYTYADGDGEAYGLLGVGASVVTSTSSATNKAYFGGSLKDDGKNATDEVDIVLIQAKTIDDAYAFAQSGAGGILAGGGSIAEANGNSTTSAYIEDNSEVFWKQDVDFDVKAIGQPKVEAYADGISAGLMAVGVSEAQATASPVISAWIGENVLIRFGTFATVSEFNFINAQETMETSASYAGGMTLTNNTDDLDIITSNSTTWESMGFEVGDLIKIEGGSLTEPAYEVIGSFDENDGRIMVLGAIDTFIDSISTQTGYTIEKVDTLDKIRRTSGSWISDGFEEGDVIEISGYDQTFEIIKISQNGKAITLDSAGALTSATGQACTIRKVDETIGNISIEASQQKTDNNTPSVKASGYTSGGSLIGMNTSSSLATNTSSTIATFKANGDYYISGTIQLLTDLTNYQYAYASGKSGSLLGIGSNPAYAYDISISQTVINNNVTIHADKIEIIAESNIENKAKSVAGRGSLLETMSAAKAYTSSMNITTATILPHSTNRSTFVANEFEFDAISNVKFNGITDSTSISLLDFGGAEIINLVNATAHADLGDIQLKAYIIDVNAKIKIDKPELSNYNMDAISGGLVSAFSSESVSTIATDAQIIVGDNANLVQLGNRFDGIDKQFQFTVKQEMYLYDSVNIDAGGGLPFPKGTSKIYVGMYEDDDDLKSDPITNWITVGDANIYSVEDFNMFNLFDSDIDAVVNVKAYGLAGAPAGESHARVHIDNKITVQEDALIHSEKNVNINIGRTENFFDRSTYDIQAQTDVFNYTAFPIVSASLEAYADNKQINMIDIEENALIETVGDEYMVTNMGYFFVNGNAQGTDAYRESAGAIFGDDTAFKLQGGDSYEDISETINIDGEVKVGINRNQSITFNKIGDDVVATLDTNSNITYYITEESVAQNIVDQIDTLEELKAEYYGNSEAVAGFQSQIDYLVNKLANLGIYEIVENEGTDEETRYYPSDVTAEIINIKNIWAQASTINFFGSNITGSGAIEAPGDVVISITNNTDLILRTNYITIPDNLGGMIYINAAEIDPTDYTNFSSIVISDIFHDENAPKPAININTNEDLRAVGDITNVRGNVEINVGGSFYVELKTDGSNEVASLRAGTLEINVGEDFVQGYSEGLFHTGGDPVSLWYPATGEIKSDVVNPKSPDNGEIIAGGQVLISAQYLNINGLIQSGFNNLEFTYSDQAELDNYVDLVKTSRVKTFNLYNGVDFKVNFNAETEQIEVTDITIQGGYMELVGTIMSTSGGEINVLDGYANINITNNTTYDIVIGDIINNQIEGTLKITDFNHNDGYDNDGNQTFRTTTYMKVGQNGSVGTTVKYIINDAINENDRTSGSSIGNNAVYTVESDQTYAFVTGQRKSDMRVEVYYKNSALGLDFLLKDTTAPSRTWTVNLDSQPLLDGAYYIDSDQTIKGNVDYAHAFYTEEYTTVSETITSVKTTSRCTSRFLGFCISRRYTTTIVYEQGSKTYNTHYVDAGYDIPITFIGSQTGTVTINSTSGTSNVILQGTIQNESGTTTINAGGRIISDGAGQISGTNVVLDAKDGIGTTLIPIKVDANGGTLKAETNKNDVVIEQLNNDVRIESIKTNSGDVILTTNYDVIPVGIETHIVGDYIEINARNIGLSETSPLIIDGNYSQLNDGLKINSIGDVFVNETSGNLYLISVKATGNVWLKVTNGSFIDNLMNEEVDQRTYAELLDLWKNMNLMGDEARAKTDETVIAYENGRTSEYHAYWETRNDQADTSVYDPNFEVQLTEEQKQAMVAQMGLTNTNDPAILAYEQKLTNQYHYLHSIYGVVGDQYIVQWEYDGSLWMNVYEPQFDSATINTNDFNDPNENDDFDNYYKNTIEITDHNFQDGQIVLYECNGGSAIDGLTCGAYYYVSIVDKDLIRLTENFNDAINDENFMEFAYTGTGTHILNSPEGISDVYIPKFDASAIVAGSNTINVGDHIYKTGQRVQYNCNSGNAVEGLECGETYYVVVVDGQNIQLTLKQSDAEAGQNQIEFTNAGTGIDHNLSEMDAMRVGSVWTEAQLKYAMSGGWLKESSDTTTAIEEENINAGGDLTLIANVGGIGNNNGSMTIDVNGGAQAISDEDRVKLASVERNDAVIINGDDETITFGYYHSLNDGDEVIFPSIYRIQDIAGLSNNTEYYAIILDEFTIKLSDEQTGLVADRNIIDITCKEVRIEMREDVDVQVGGEVDIISDQHIYLGSEGSLSFNNALSGENPGAGEDIMRIKVGNDILWTGSANNAFSGGDLILEAGGGAIGTETDYVQIDLFQDASLTARARENIYIKEINNLNGYGISVDTIYSPNDVYIMAYNLYDSFDLKTYDENVANKGMINIKADHINLAISGNVGVRDTDPFSPLQDPDRYYLEDYSIEVLPLTSLSAQVYGDLSLGMIGNFLAESIIAHGEHIFLSATGNFVDINDDNLTFNPDIDARNPNAEIFMISYNGSIGEANNDWDMEVRNNTASSHIALEAEYDIFFTELTDDMYLNSVTTHAGKAFIFAPQNIYDANVSPYNVIAGNTKLYAGDGIGLENDPLTSIAINMQGYVENGNAYIYNYGPVTIKSLDGGATGFDGNGDVNLQASSPITVSSDIIALGNIILTANDSPAFDYDIFTLINSIVIQSTSGKVTICAGDDINLQENSQVIAENGTITITVNCTNVDNATSSMNLKGQINSPSVTLNGSDIADNFNVDQSAKITDFTINMLDGNDQFTWDNNTTDLIWTANAGDGDDFIYIKALDVTSKAYLNGDNDNDTFKIADNLEVDIIIDGGDGTKNTIDFSDWTVPVTVTFDQLGTITGYSGTITGIQDVDGNLERYDNIRDVIGSTAYFIFQSGDLDTIFRLLNATTFEFEMGGRIGTLTNFNELRAGAGDDIFEMHAPNNYLMFTNDGNDTLSYEPYLTDVNLDMINKIYTDINNSINGIENLRGGAGNDILIGDHGGNKLRGGSGDDLITGHNGNDIYQIDALAGLDTIIEKRNQGTDWIDYSVQTSGVNLEITAEEIIDLLDITLSSYVDYKDQSIESVQLSQHNDLVNFTTENNNLNIYGGAGDDGFTFTNEITKLGSIFGQAGLDYLDTRLLTTDNEVEIISHTTNGYKIKLDNLYFNDIDLLELSDTVISTVTTRIANGNFNLSRMLYVDNYTHDLQNLFINRADIINGSNGNDIFNIYGLIDYELYGHNGNDMFNIFDSASTTNIVDGGFGYDNISFNLSSTGIEISLLAESRAGGMSGIDNLGIFTIPFESIDSLVGTIYSDKLYGIIDAANEFTFTSPNSGYVKAKNRMISFASFENFTGGDEDDSFILNEGAIISGNINGGNGSDTISYQNRFDSVYVDLGLGIIPDLMGIVFGIENLTGGFGNDTLIGDDNDNILKGGSGNDELYGLGGDDHLWTGLGWMDILVGGDGFDIAYYHWKNKTPLQYIDCEKIIFLQPPFVWYQIDFTDGSFANVRIRKGYDISLVLYDDVVTILHSYLDYYKFNKYLHIEQLHPNGFLLDLFAGGMVLNIFIPDFLNDKELVICYWDNEEQKWIEIETISYRYSDGNRYLIADVKISGYYAITIKGKSPFNLDFLNNWIPDYWLAF